MVQGNPGVQIKAESYFQAGDFKIQPRIQKMYLLLFLRKFVVGELDAIKGINSERRGIQDTLHPTQEK